MIKTMSLIFLLLTVNANELYPAGSGTTSDLSVQAFSHPMKSVRGQDRRDFVVGNSFFQTVWVTSPSSTPLRDGLGPIYNATSCAACHFKDGRGRGLPEVDGRTDISLLFRIRVKDAQGNITPHPEYGGQFQPFGLSGVEGEGESRVSFSKVTGKFADGTSYELQKPNYVFSKLTQGQFSNNTILSPRVGPQMIGLGLLENIREADILKNVDPNDKDGNGISGRANFVYSEILKTKVIGRFGWKAGKPSLIEQNAAAFNGDIGITTNIFPEEECSYVQSDCISKMTAIDLEDDLLNKVTKYTQLLAVPVRRIDNPEASKRGQNNFHQIGCQSCHTPSYTTGNSSEYAVLNNQKIYPYTDMLLHDMGKELADHDEVLANEGEATTYEWRTPPLWGLGMIETVNGHTRYLHDGRARNLEEAILWHGGEAKLVKEKYLKLSKLEREDLVKFLKSL
ncbi:di-heme oxidoredictase family protein [Bacteriovorax sp. Seq25_V]|uniref:di-heme oxidoreductase family protein n=1 Tax=Bacteriovorax sp. Seq25_V TaxID=1201288 RepID=UPI000389EC45|nr:di-heme oxidoredictase family protein [Bacteriovorax sp. Seq25_V]EQC46081.1 PF06537 family protein [Bacteriovorax sp. Seq25_V]